jgi:hypothetical protein
MAILNYRTRIAADVTVGEIQRALAKAGASAIMSEYDDSGNIVSLSFRLKMGEDSIGFTLPTDWRPVQQVLTSQRRTNKNVSDSEVTSRNVSWRITKDWVEAQLAIIETKMVTTAQVFLPYAITKDGTSMYEHVAANTSLLLTQGSSQ